ncbi:MAG: PepSY domain-containing protein [Proteobacteria bacterium]|nr:PepSY domain-containing protein [Pseudomonadota bacterium]
MKPVLLAAAALLASTSLVIAQPGTPPDTATTPSVPPAGMPGTAQSATSAQTQIEASGYTNIKDLKRQNDGSWRARATKNNEEVAVSVDSTGLVTQMSQ